MWFLFLVGCRAALPLYSVEDWTALPGVQPLDSAEYQLVLSPNKFYGAQRKADVLAFQELLKSIVGPNVVVGKDTIRQITDFDISLMDPSQLQTDRETNWELRLRTTLEGPSDAIGISDLTLKRGDVPKGFVWSPGRVINAAAATVTDVEDKFELDIQCAERDYTRALKLEFSRFTLPRILTYKDAETYFPEMFQMPELKSSFKVRKGTKLPVEVVYFDWTTTVSATINGTKIDFVLQTRHNSFSDAKDGMEGFVVRPPEINYRLKREDATKAIQSTLTKIFNRLLDSPWNGHDDCGKWNGRKACPPGWKLTNGACARAGDSTIPKFLTPRGAPKSGN